MLGVGPRLGWILAPALVFCHFGPRTNIMASVMQVTVISKPAVAPITKMNNGDIIMVPVFLCSCIAEEKSIGVGG